MTGSIKALWSSTLSSGYPILLQEFCQYKSSSIISQYSCTPLIRSKTKRVLSKRSSLYSYPWNNLLLSLLCLYSDLVPFLLICSMFCINLPIFKDPSFWYRAFRQGPPKSGCSPCSNFFKIVANIVWWTRLSSYKHVLRFLNRIEVKNMHIFSLFVAWNKPQYIQHNLIKSSIKYFVIFDVNIIFELKCSFLNFKILKNSWFQYNTYTYTHHLLHKEKLVFPVACYFVAKVQFLCSYPKIN